MQRRYLLNALIILLFSLLVEVADIQGLRLQDTVPDGSKPMSRFSSGTPFDFGQIC